MKKNKKILLNIICVLSCLILAILIVIFALMQLYERKNRYREEEISKKESTEESTGAEHMETQTQQESEEEVSCSEPEYQFTEEELTISIDGLDREYTIAWVSDLHLVSDHEAGDKLGDVHAEYLDAIERRYEELAVTSDGVHAENLWSDVIRYLNYHQFDGVIFGGDIMDYCSNSNIAMIKEGLDSLNTRYMYIRADHDYGSYYGGVFFTETESRTLHQKIDGDEISHKFWDMGDFIVLGIDNSTKDMPEYYLNMVSEVFTREKPVIIATHVPYESQLDTSLAELSIQVRNTIYYWSSASERYNPNPVTNQYLDTIYNPDSVVAQVLAGHLHASWDGMLSEQVPQHIFAPAFSGSIGIIHIVPKQETEGVE